MAAHYVNPRTQKRIFIGTLSKEILGKIVSGKECSASEGATESAFRKNLELELLSRGIIVPKDMIEPISQHYYDAHSLTSFPIFGFFNSVLCYPERIPDGDAVALIGVPFDSGATKPGSRFGPRLIRDASKSIMFRSKSISELYSISDQGMVGDLVKPNKVFDMGDLIVANSRREEVFKKIEDVYNCLEPNHVPFMIGGDHSLTYSAVKAVSKKHSDLTLIQLDHHLDVSVSGNIDSSDRIFHSNFITYLKKDVPQIEIFQVGVSEYQSTFSGTTAFEFRDRLKEIGTQYSNLQIKRHGYSDIPMPMNKKVYISIDVDVLERVEISDTGHPSNIGITIESLLNILEKIVSSNTVVGLDIMEFGKPKDDTSSFAEAKTVAVIILELLRYIQRKKVD